MKTVSSEIGDEKQRTKGGVEALNASRGNTLGAVPHRLGLLTNPTCGADCRIALLSYISWDVGHIGRCLSSYASCYVMLCYA